MTCNERENPVNIHAGDLVMWWNKATWVLIIAEPGHINSIDRCRYPTNEELAEHGLQRITEVPKTPKLTVAMHRIVTLPDTTELDLECISSIGPVYVETKEACAERMGLGCPSRDNTYVVSMKNSEQQRWSNARVPRDELIRLWKGESDVR
jgi:hypothetical protein